MRVAGSWWKADGLGQRQTWILGWYVFFEGDPAIAVQLEVLVEAMWSKKLIPQSKLKAYMDGRMIATTQTGRKDLLGAALSFTRHFDQQVGFQMSSGKAQVWSCEDHAPSDFILEHSGHKFNPADVNSCITRRDLLKFQSP